MARPACLLALAAALALTAAGRSSDSGRCPLALGKSPFDVDKFAGQWYILAGTPLFGPQLSKCPRFTIAPPNRSGGDLLFNITFEAQSPRDGSPYGLESITQAYLPGHASLSLGVWRLIGTEKWSDVYIQSVVATDYETYAIFLGCRSVFDSASGRFGRELGAQVWGRQKSLSSDTLSALSNLLTSYDVDAGDIQTADQSCGY